MTKLFKTNIVTPDTAKDIIKNSVLANRVVMISGQPGIGKSEIVRQVARELDLEMIDHRLSTSAIEDLTGLPQFTKAIGSDNKEHDLAKFTPLNIFPMEWWKIPNGKKGWLLFFDEINSADQSIVAACYKIILDRMVGLNKLHPNCHIVCAGNRAEDNAITNSLGTAMMSRMSHIELKVDFDMWLSNVALKNNYDFRIIAFLKAYPELLNQFDPEKDTETYSCPRTWEFINDYLYQATEEYFEKEPEGRVTKMPLPKWFQPLASGTITPDTANKFCSFCANISKMITFEQIMADPENCEIPEEIDIRYAVILVCSSHIESDNISKIWKYISRFDRSNQILFIRDVAANKPNLITRKDFREILKDSVDELKELGVL